MKLKGFLLIAACVASASAAAQAPVVPTDLNATLARIGDHVAQYYLRARSLVCIETVTLQPLQSTMSYEGFGRELVYELRSQHKLPAFSYHKEFEFQPGSSGGVDRYGGPRKMK